MYHLGLWTALKISKASGTSIINQMIAFNHVTPTVSQLAVIYILGVFPIDMVCVLQRKQNLLCQKTIV